MSAAAKPVRFSLDEIEVAIMDATMSGRVYSQGGEKASPAEFHRSSLTHALEAVIRHRHGKRKHRRELLETRA